jgi:glutathione peroxidase
MWFNTSIRGLEAIYKQYKDDNFVIIGFPANNFASQEPGIKKLLLLSIELWSDFSYDGESICKGADICALYQFLTQKS